MFMSLAPKSPDGISREPSIPPTCGSSFETLAKCWRPFTGKHYDLARQMCNYWAEFIKKGDPNDADADGTQMERWEAFSREGCEMMTFFEKPAVEKKPEGEIMAFLTK